ncbi:hypothetical protein ACFLV0_06675 [Chloroflexota bacterium]
MRNCITILEPTAESGEAAAVNIARADDLTGKKIAFVSNEGWRCMPTIWKRLSQVLLEKHHVSETLMFPMQKPAPAEVIDEVTRKSHVAIVGLGN